MKYTALNGRRVPFDPEDCEEWEIVAWPPHHVLRFGLCHGMGEHILYRHTDKAGRRHWIDYRASIDQEHEWLEGDSFVQDILEIRREEAFRILIENGKSPPDDDWPPIICSEAELARQMGKKPGYSHFTDRMTTRGVIARWEPVEGNPRLRRYWLADQVEHSRILEALKVARRRTGVEPT
jgi:hypothetical protein